MTAKELDVAGSLMLAATKVKIDFVDAVGVKNAESAVTRLRINAAVAAMVELNSKSHSLEGNGLK